MRNLSDMFAMLRAHNMKLNPEKCTFEVNPENIQPIAEMPSPQTIKEIQRLTGKVVTLNRFISKMADKCLPFFRALRKTFSWTEECQITFEQLKQYRTSPSHF
ncbi:protein NYNRIN-like [Gossypium australe]|uniref:Protein NYNRIN-like n=1 Tax=Gossypium australe TaxID=47621 RepID=A0A5B6V8U7_9ROSI|nr:protein NYNRIN-like [Gossypium australe]